METTAKAINNSGLIAGNFLHKKSSTRSGYVRTPS
jgi:hypothetical protein